jgi:hypothetical protein
MKRSLAGSVAPMSYRNTAVALCLSFALVMAGCGSDGSELAASEPSVADVTAPTVELTGTWERVTTCEQLVGALEQAGLDAWIPEMVVGNQFIPGVTELSALRDPSDPCKNAVPRRHSHFFTEDGVFGSLAFNGDKVDDGTYEMTGENTFAITKEFPQPVTFHYEIDGNTITFDPVIPTCTPDCFEAAWSVSVAYPGEEWHRRQ